MSWIETIVLSILQGLTEFLPVSSDGHLAITQLAFAARDGRTLSGSESLFFNVMLHVGTWLAIVLYYRHTGFQLAGRLAAGGDDAAATRRSVVRTLVLAAVATLPAVGVGLFLKDHVERATTSLAMSGLGFLITSAVLMTTLRLPGGTKDVWTTTGRDALLIGMAQALAILPGVSRSGLTVAMALALGLSRTWAVGFSLIMALVAIPGAALLEVLDLDAASLQPGQIARTGVGMLLAMLVGYAAVTWLVRIVRSGRLWYFSVYLAVLGMIVLGIVLAGGSEPDGERLASLGGAVGVAAR
jgi:undecaprenyl-diphosphatase